MEDVGWLVVMLIGILNAGCIYPHQAAPISHAPEAAEFSMQTTDRLAIPSVGGNYLVRPDGGERRILRQLLHEMQLTRHLVDEAYAHRDEEGRVRVDYARLAVEFDQILLGLRRTLSATETSPREAMDITGDYQLYD